MEKTILELLNMSSSNNYGLLKDIAQRCGIIDGSVVEKSKELLGLLDSKCSISCPESCKVVVCLELACSLSKSTVLRKEDAVKYSGCKSKSYVNIYNNIAKLLNLDKVYSVRDVCLQLGVIEIQTEAKALLDAFNDGMYDSDKDFEHPMYSCAAVYLTARENKVPVSLPKLVEISRVKKKEFQLVLAMLQPFLKNKQKARNKRSNLREIKENPSTEVKAETRTSKQKPEVSDLEFREWKRRMLED